VGWCSDGWRAYPKAITKAYGEPVRTGSRRGRAPLVVPEGVSLTQTIKHRDEHGRLLNVEIRATIGAAAAAAEVEQQPVAVLTSSGSTECLETGSGVPDAQDTRRLRQEHLYVGRTVWAGALRAQLATGAPGA
jgi:hypothetical protein